MADVTVHKLRSRRAGTLTFLNVDEEYGSVAVRGHNFKSTPTYLLQSGDSFMLIQFDDLKTADNWMESNLVYKHYKVTPITWVEES